MTEAAQTAAAEPAPQGADPAEVQGAEATNGNELYAPFLEGVPEENHDLVVAALKAQDSEFTKKFQSRAEQLKPFEELGVLEQDPQAIGQYLQLDQAMQAAQEGNEQAMEAVYQWWDNVGESLKFYDNGGDSEAGGEPDDDGDFDVLDMDKAAFDKAVAAKVSEALAPFQQEREQQTQAQQRAAEEAQAHETVDGWISAVKEANEGVFDGDEGEALLEEVLELASLFPESENPVQDGLKRYQSLVSKGEKGLFAQKQGQPAVPEPGGKPDTTPPVPRTMNDAKALALQYVGNGKQIQT